MGLFDIAGSGLAGACEGAFLVAEEQAFEQRLGQAAAIHFEKRLGRTRTGGMQQAGRQILAGAALAFEQDRGIKPGDLADLGQRPLHGRRLADDQRQIRLAGQALAQAVDLAIGAIEFKRLADHRLDRLEIVEWLGLVVEQAFAHRRHGIADIGEAGHQDADQMWPAGPELAQQFNAVGVGQALIHQHQVEVVSGKALTRLGPGQRQGHLRRLGEQPVEQYAGMAIVIDDQNFRQHVSRFRAPLTAWRASPPVAR